MGAFDDLIPTQQKENPFSDLIPQGGVLIKNQSGQYPSIGQPQFFIEGRPPGILDRVGQMLQGPPSGEPFFSRIFNPPVENQLFRTDEQQPPTTVLGGIGRGLENIANSVATPGGLAAGAVAGPLMALGRIPALLTGGAGLLATAPTLGQSAGILSPGSGATGPQRAEAAVLPAAMALPIAHNVFADLIKPTPQLQGPAVPRPGQPEYLTFATSVAQSSRSRPTSEQNAISPTAPSTPVDSTRVPASKPPTTGQAFNLFREIPINQAAKQFQQEAKVDFAKMKNDDLAAAYEQSKQKATQLGISGDFNAAVQEATRGQFFREEMNRRDAQHSLKAAASGLKFATQNKTMSPEEIAAAQQHGDEIFQLIQNDPPSAVKAAQNLYEAIRTRNAQGQNVGQEETQSKEQNAASVESQVQVPKQQPTRTRSNGGLDVKGAGVLTDAERAEEQKRLANLGEGGFLIAPREVWNSLFNNKSTKVDPQQMLGRLKNKLGETSATFQALASSGLSQFLSQPRSVDEVEKWAQENGPKVEVRKFGAVSQDLQTKRLAEITHLVDTKFKDFTINSSDGSVIMEPEQTIVQPENIPNKELSKLMIEYRDLQKTRDLSTSSKSHWQSIAPKPESEMPGYVEIAVVKPQKPKGVPEGTMGGYTDPTTGEYYAEGQNRHRELADIQFPSSHNFPPNTLGFVRGYMEPLPNGKKVFHVIEVQSDWAQTHRNIEAELKGNSKYADPLLQHYERLALKAAIDHARSEGADAIAISDAETAMMTEGHDRNYPMWVAEFPSNERTRAYFKNWQGAKIDPFELNNEPQKIVVRDNRIETLQQAANVLGVKIKPEINIAQAPGMHLHYDQTLPKIAGELTGEKGERVGFGEHRMAVTPIQLGEVQPNFANLTEAQVRDYMEGRTGGTKPRPDLIFRTPSGQPKTDITARMFNIGKAKKEFSLYGRSGAIFPRATPRQGAPRTLGQIAQSQQTALGNLRNKFVASIKTNKPKEEIVRLKDAADNQARIFADQQANGLRLRVKDVFGPVSEQALRAVTAAVEANGDRNKLNQFITIANQAKDKVAENAAIFANNNWDKLKPLVDYVNSVHDQELNDEQNAGLDVDKREGYIRHAYDMSKIPSSLVDTFLGTSGQGSQRGFQKSRTFDTLYDAIKGGYGKAIRSWDAANLVENRLRHGQQMVNDVKWMEGLKGINDPTTKKPIVTNLIKKPKANGQFDMVPPNGYETWAPFRGAGVAVHRGYGKILNSVTAMSQLRGSEIKGLPVGQMLMKGTGTLKHSMLLFDTYHAVRMSLRGASHGVFGPSKGLSLLEYSPKDLDLALKVGEINKEAYDYAKANQPFAQELIKKGLNVGRIAEGLDSEVIRDLLPQLGIKAPADFNKWVFEKLTRGIMMDAAVKEYQRTKDLTQTVKDINVYYGNLGRQGVFKSATFQDLARLVFLAPQWFESMARTEAGAIGQAVRVPFTGKTGSLVKGTSALILAMFVATQVANLASRQQFTFQNEEADHKLDAWIPSVGGGNGFWVSPFTVPMELTHDIIRYSAAGKSPLTTAAQIISNKESPLFRAEETLRTGEDYEGNKLGDKQRLTTATENLLPVPLPAQPLIKGGYPGQVQRQLMASAGFKAEPAQGAKSTITNLRRQFLYKIGKASQPDYTPSKYAPLIKALEANDIPTAKQEYQTLLAAQIKEHTDDPNPQHAALEDFQKFFEKYGENRGQADKPQEAAFFKTLTYHQQQLYKQVQQQNQAVEDAFFKNIQDKMSGHEPRGIRPPTIRRFRHFSQ